MRTQTCITATPPEVHTSKFFKICYTEDIQIATSKKFAQLRTKSKYTVCGILLVSEQIKLRVSVL